MSAEHSPSERPSQHRTRKRALCAAAGGTLAATALVAPLAACAGNVQSPNPNRSAHLVAPSGRPAPIIFLDCRPNGRPRKLVITRNSSAEIDAGVTNRLGVAAKRGPDGEVYSVTEGPRRDPMLFSRYDPGTTVYVDHPAPNETVVVSAAPLDAHGHQPNAIVAACSDSLNTTDPQWLESVTLN